MYDMLYTEYVVLYYTNATNYNKEREKDEEL